jgi:hypothetical protein
MFDVDLIQRIKVSGIFLLQIYKITTGTLLTLFIPQKCTSFNNSTQLLDTTICSLTENYENNDIYHQKTLYWNIFTMTIFVGYYLIELYRENWSIQYLDIDNNKPDNSLKEIIKEYKSLDVKMDRMNRYYLYTLNATIFTYFINLLLMIKIIKNDYHSSSTLSCFFSFSLLVLMKLYNSYTVATQSVKNDKMMSAYMSEFVSFNVIDKDHIKPTRTNKP